MKRTLKILALTALIVGGLLVPATAANAATTDVCAGSVPAGWLKINDHWDPTRCGSPTAIVDNVWTITTYFDKPVGWTMWVCAGWRPFNWAGLTTRWDPTSCGHPTAIVPNMWLIQRQF